MDKNKKQFKHSKLFISLTSIVSVMSFGSVVGIPFIGNKLVNIQNYNSYLNSTNNIDKNVSDSINDNLLNNNTSIQNR